MCGVMLLVQMEMVKSCLIFIFRFGLFAFNIHNCFFLQAAHDSVVLFLILSYAFYAFGMMFTVCELCQRVTDSFDEINNRIMAFDWYKYPLKIQKLLPILLIGTQKPVVFECFGSISTLRETFKKVRKKGKILFSRTYLLTKIYL